MPSLSARLQQALRAEQAQEKHSSYRHQCRSEGKFVSGVTQGILLRCRCKAFPAFSANILCHHRMNAFLSKTSKFMLLSDTLRTELEFYRNEIHVSQSYAPIIDITVSRRHNFRHKSVPVSCRCIRVPFTFTSWVLFSWEFF